ncbi:MAG TPA: methyl-accepting chemotaxis protein [Candidatus Binatia bacterium]|nr:methyl-accepting chemotaxis protein [Candidatus Binatia bacterium]
MKNLKVWQKLVLMGAVFMVPFAAVTYKMISSVNVLGTEFARQEIRGLEYYTPLLSLLKNLQLHRGMANALLSGDKSFKETLDGKAAEIENDIKKVHAVNERLNSALGVGAKWTALSAAGRDLLSKTSTLSIEASFQQHTNVIKDTIALIADVSDASNLTLDPDLDSYYLMNVLIFQAPELTEILAQTRDLGSGVAALKKASPQQLETMNRLTVLADFLQKKVDESLSKAAKSNEALRPQLEARARVDTKALENATAAILATTATDYFATMTRNINAIYETQGSATVLLNGLLNKRVEKFQKEVRTTLAWAFLGLLAVSAVGFFIMRDITVSLREVVQVADQIAIGDLAVPLSSISRKDEIGALAKSFDRMVASLRTMVGVAERIAAGDLLVQIKPQSERDVMGNALANMVERLSTLVGEVQKSGIRVNSSVTEIAATAKQQQATATEIAATTTQIGATSKEISATSKELVKTMNEVSTAAEQSAGLASGGHVGLSRMEESMRHIMEAASSINSKLTVLNEKAGNINQVVTTITKVADQTNLLSLNAAIEAEKAGEYGRGFAVVATEIRRLADQTAVATYDIEQMVKEIQSAVSAGVMGMDKFSEEVRRGMQEIEQVGTQLAQIIQQVEALAPRCEAVNEGMQAHATGAEQITEALGQLSQAAQQTVDSLRQSGHALEGLNQVSSDLRSGVSRFKLVA